MSRLWCALEICNFSKISKQSITHKRYISTSSPFYGKRNFRKFTFPNRSTCQADKDYLRKHPEAVDRRGVRPYGVWENRNFTIIPEQVPELIVPDLTGCNLKPYVSYKTADIYQEKFTAEHLFHCSYVPKMKKDFKEGKLDEEGNPLEPSENETMNAEEAWLKARKSGSDLFG